MHYPTSPRKNFVEKIHNVDITDDYRWLEDIESQPTQEWISAQSKFTQEYLEKLPGRDKLQERLRQLWNFDKYDAPVQKQGRLFYTHNNGLQNQPVLFWQEGYAGKPIELIDPNKLSGDGTLALVGYVPSPDGKFVAYGISAAGSDWMIWNVRNVETGKDTEDTIEWVKFSWVSWTKDSSGFFYSRYDAPVSGEQDFKGTNFHQKLFFHRIGQLQVLDVLIHEDADQKEWGFGGEVTDDGEFLVISVWKGTHRENGILIKELAKLTEQPQNLLMDFDASYQYLGNDGNRFYFETDFDAPLSRIIAIDRQNPDRKHWKEVIPEGKDAIVASSWVGNRLFVTRLHDVASQITCYSLDGKIISIPQLPGSGTVTSFIGPSSEDARYAFYLFTNFFTPLEVYRYDLETGESVLFKQPRVTFDPKEFFMQQVFYPGKDGTLIPMFICYKKGLMINGDAPTYLYGYGGFNAPSLPAFMVSALLWMEIGGIFALANIRGGGEYGKAWHEAGTKAQKQNVFDDFIAAGEWLIANGYTCTPRLAIGGRSNGGLLVGACLTQRPDLFGAALPIVGVLDMLRFHKFTIGWAWVSDYGSPDNPVDFNYLSAYSPYHHIQDGQAYPPTLICTGDHDDRVFPAHSFKFAARLQTAQAGSAPVLIRIDVRAGHGAGKPTAKQIEELADQWAFLANALNHEIK